MAQLLEVQNKRNQTSSKIVNQQEINEVYKKFYGVYGGNKEHYFAMQYLVKKFNITEEESAAYIVFDTDAYGIDAYYLDKVKGVLHLFKFSCTADHISFKGSMEKLAKVGIDKIFVDEFKNENENVTISRLKNSL